MSGGCQVFVEAGLIPSIVENRELQDLIDTEHMNAFGMTRKQRRADSKLGAKDTKVDWGIYNAPAIRLSYRLVS